MATIVSSGAEGSVSVHLQEDRIRRRFVLQIDEDRSFEDLWRWLALAGAGKRLTSLGHRKQRSSLQSASWTFVCCLLETAALANTVASAVRRSAVH